MQSGRMRAGTKRRARKTRRTRTKPLSTPRWSVFHDLFPGEESCSDRNASTLSFDTHRLRADDLSAQSSAFLSSRQMSEGLRLVVRPGHPRNLHLAESEPYKLEETGRSSSSRS